MLNLRMLLDELNISPLRLYTSDFDGSLRMESFAFFCGQKALEPQCLYLLPSTKLSELPELTAETELIILTDNQKKIDSLEKNGIPYALLDSNLYDPFSLGNEITRIFLKYTRLYEEMKLAKYENDSLQRLVDLFTPVFGNEIILMSSEYYMLAYSYDHLRLYEVSNLTPLDSSRRLPLEILEFFKNDAIYASVRDLKDPFLYRASVFSVDVLCMNVFLNDRFACRCVISEIDRPLRPYDQALLRIFTAFVQECYDIKGRFSWKNEKTNDLSAIFLRMLKKKPFDEEIYRNLLLENNLSADSAYVCALIRPEASDYYNQTLPYYVQMISKTFPSVWSMEYKKHIVCFISLKPFNNSLENFHREFVYLLRDHYFHAGYSQVFHELSTIEPYYQQAKVALKEGLKQNPMIWSYRFSDFTMSYMKHLLTKDMEASYLCSPEILLLRKYDEENESEYVKTLQTYLLNSQNALKTAQDLFIHRSTMNYRLQRIRELTGIDFEDKNKLFSLNVSFALLYEP